MATTDDLFDDLMVKCKKPGDLVGENSLLSQLFRTTLQSTIQGGMKAHQDRNSSIVDNDIQEKT